jgi:hypothetical protein
MSDGNFNRALLPSTPYRSGVRMGQQQAKVKAVKALQKALTEVLPPLTDAQKESISKCFEQELRFLP